MVNLLYKTVYFGCGLGLALSLACSRQSQDPAAGKPRLDFSLKDTQGQVQTLQNYRNKKVILVDFWATWCGPCRSTIPHLNAFYGKHHGLIEVIGISIDENDPEGVTDFVRNQAIAYPVLLDGLPVAKQHRINSIPALMLVDAQGMVLAQHIGAIDEQTLEALVQPYL